MFHILPGNFFVPLSSPNRIVYWECICKLFTTMEHQLSFGVERDVLVDELEYYFDQTQAAEMEEDEFQCSVHWQPCVEGAAGAGEKEERFTE